MSADVAVEGGGPERRPAAAPAGFAAAAARGSVWTTSQVIVNKLVTVAVGVALSYILSEADYGLASFAANLSVFAFVLPTFVMGDVLLADGKRFDRVAGAANGVMWAAAVAMFAVVAAAALPIERLLDRQGLALLVVVAGTRPLADAVLAVANARLRMDLAYKRMAILDGAVTLATTVAAIGLALGGAGAIALTLPPIAALAGRGVLYWQSIRGRVPLRIEREEVRPIARRFAVAGVGQYLHNIVGSLEVVVLGLLTNEVELGLYVFAATYAFQSNSIIATQLASVLQPIFVHIHDDAQRQVSAFLRATRLLSSVAVPLCLIQAAIAVPAITLVFSEKWRGSIAPFAALSIAQTFLFVCAPSIALLKAQGRFRAYFFWQFGQMVGSVLLFVFATKYGAEHALALAAAVGLPAEANAGKALAMSLASIVSWGISCPVAVWLGGRRADLGVRATLRVFMEPWIVTVPVAAALVAAWIGLRGAVSGPWADGLAIGVLAPVAAVVSIAGCIVLRRDTREDFLRVVERVRRRRK